MEECHCNLNGSTRNYRQLWTTHDIWIDNQVSSTQTTHVNPRTSLMHANLTAVYQVGLLPFARGFSNQKSEFIIPKKHSWQQNKNQNRLRAVIEWDMQQCCHARSPRVSNVPSMSSFAALLCFQIIRPTDRLCAFPFAVGAVSKVWVNLRWHSLGLC